MFVAVRFSSLVYSTVLVFLSWLVVVFSSGVVFSFPLAVVFLHISVHLRILLGCVPSEKGRWLRFGACLCL